MAKLSAFIIAKNEEGRIEKAILSLKNLADEIIVVDSGSTDNTVEKAEKLGAKVIFNEWPGYVAQKSFGENLCENDWIINLDADEELSENLRSEIESLFKSDIQDRYYAYSIQLTIIHRNENYPRRFAPANECVRIYNRKFCSFSRVKASTTKDSVQFNENIINPKEKIHKLNEPAYHRSASSIEQLVSKANFYSGEQAMDINMEGREISNLRIIFEFFICFFKAFFIRRYFIFGMYGFIDSMIFGFARFLRLAKAKEKKT